MITRAQRLRKNPTVAEIRFWRLIDPLRRAGYHFRKQAPLGPFVVDFACHQAKLVIEIDGYSHHIGVAPLRDRERDAALERHGFAVLRFSNLEVMDNPEGVYAVLHSVLEERTPSLPSPRGSVRPEHVATSLPANKLI